MGTYGYSTDPAVRPHAVTSAGNRSFTYHDNGSMITSARDGWIYRAVEYSVFNKPTLINATWPKTASAEFF